MQRCARLLMSLIFGILLAAFGFAQFPLWGDSLGVREPVRAVAGRDDAGGGVVAVTHQGDFLGGSQVWLASYDPFLTRKWSTQYVGDGMSEYEAVAVSTHLNGRTALLVRGLRTGQTILAVYSSTGAKLWERVVPSTVGELIPAAVSVQPNGTVLYFGTASGINGITMARFTSTGSLLSNVGISNNAPGEILDTEFVEDRVFALIDLGDGFAVSQYSYATNTRTWWREQAAGQPRAMAVAPNGTVYVGLMLGSPTPRATIYAWPDRIGTVPGVTQIPAGGLAGEQVFGVEAFAQGGVDRVRALVRTAGVSAGISVLSFSGDPFGITTPVAGITGNLVRVDNTVAFSAQSTPSVATQWWLNGMSRDYPSLVRAFGTASGPVRGWQMLRGADMTFGLQGITAERFGGWDEQQIVAGTDDQPVALASDDTGNAVWLRDYRNGPSRVLVAERVGRTGNRLWTRSIASVDPSVNAAVRVLPHRDVAVAYGGENGLNVVRLASADGRVIWRRQFNLRSSLIEVRHMLATAGGDLVVVGEGDTSSNFDALAVRVSGAGSLQWRTFYGNTEPVRVGGAALDSSDNLALVLQAGSNRKMLKFAGSNGVFQWALAFPFSSFGPIVRTVDNGFVALVNTGSNAAVKVATNGSIAWQRPITFDGISSIFLDSVTRLPNGNFVVLGNGRNTENRNRLVLAVLDPAGTILHRRIVQPASGRVFGDEGISVVADPSGLIHAVTLEVWMDGVEKRRPATLTFTPNLTEVTRRYSLPTSVTGNGSYGAPGLDGELFVTGTERRPTTDTDTFLTRERYNVRPVAVANAYSVNRGQTLTIAGPGVLANDSNPIPGAALSAAVVAPAPAGLTFGANGGFTYRAPATPGTVTFRYQAVLGPNRSAPATVTITVR